MWSDLFDSVLTLSWQAGIIALVIMALRPLLKRAPRWAVCLLWLLVAVRLMLPASLTPQSAVSLQSEEPLPARAYHEMQQREETYAYTLPEQRTEEMQVYKAETVSTRVLPRLWLIGVGCMLLYMVLSYYRVWLKTLDAPRLFDNVYQCDEYGTPFVLGLFAPRIYVPSTVSQEDLPQVLAHERCHLRRRDHLVKLLAFLLLALHWFNPVLWAAYILLGRDMERACDELALKDADTAQRAAYSRALVSCATTPRATALCPLAFGEVAVKERVKAVLTAKKTARWALVLVGVAAVVICIFLLTKPVDTDTSPEPTPPPVDTNTSLEPTPLPLWMQNNSVVYYDGTLQRTIGQGGDLTEDEIASRQDIQMIGMYDDTILVEPCTKVEYDLHGFLQNVYYLNGFGEYQLAPLSARTTVSLPRWMVPNSFVHVDENMVLSFTQGNFLLPEEIEARKDIRKAGGITAGALACEPNMMAQYGADGQIVMLYRKEADGTYSGIRPENWPVYTATSSLYALRTPYVGDAVAVGEILQALKLPSMVQGVTFRFQYGLTTSGDSYGVTVAYTVENRSIDWDEADNQAMAVKGYMALALIDNADWFSFQINMPYTRGAIVSGDVEYPYLYADDFADDIAAARASAEGLNTLQEKLTKLANRGELDNWVYRPATVEDMVNAPATVYEYDEAQMAQEYTTWPSTAENDPISADPAAYGITYTSVPDWETVPLSYLCAYYLGGNSNHQRDAIAPLSWRWLEAPNTFYAYMSRLSAQTAPNSQKNAASTILDDVRGYFLAYSDTTTETYTRDGLTVELSGVIRVTSAVANDGGGNVELPVYVLHPTDGRMKVVSRDSSLSWKLYAENGAWTELPRSGDLPLSTSDCGVGMEDVYAFLIQWPMA